MRVVFITTYFYPVQGGVENHVVHIAEELVKAGHEVHVITSDRSQGRKFPKEEVYDCQIPEDAASE